MTRPMPGPPEKYQVLGHAVIVWEGGNGRYYPPIPTDAKHLTDAECAAEYWRAGWIASLDFHDEHEADEASTWHRFATHPHAFKETP